MLDYENQMLLDIVSTDGLVVAAKGLGLEQVFASLLKVYSDAGNLVLVLGTSEREEEYFIERLQADPAVQLQPKKITTDIGTSERSRVYLQGGVLFVTTRILVVDLLTERIPVHLITGLLLYRAHQTAGSCQEAFILRLFREKNKTGFIKAFSTAPGAFRSGHTSVERAMRTLFLAHLYLWPRFRSEVTASLKESQPDVVELHMGLTPAMMTIQTAVLDLVNFTLQELRRLNPTLEAYDEMTVENAVSRTFHQMLQRELDPIWHQLSWKTKQLVSDLKTLRMVLNFLTQYDCITFYAFVSALRTTENAMKSGGWMILDAAETLFQASKERVFGPFKTAQEFETKRKKLAATRNPQDLPFELNPKWEALTEIMGEIKLDVVKNEEGGDQGLTEKVLVLTSDERTAAQVQDILSLGAPTLLARLYNKSLGERFGLIPGVPTEDKATAPVKKEPKHKGQGKKSQTLTQMARTEEETANLILTTTDSPLAMVQSMQIGIFEVYKLVYDLKPRFVIMHDIEMSVVRLLEVFQAKHPDFPIRVYFLMFDKSIEEQAYLTTLRKEKEAFENIIKEKASMVIPEDREGKSGENPDLLRDPSKASDVIMQISNALTRKGGGAEDGSQQPNPKVIVDMREFRSELPSLIHRRGIDIEPVTIEVGDYILTPEICVERKSISDLIGSLQNGRLYNQATSMTRFYPKPMLLIEFDQNKPFALQGKYYMSRDIGSTDITARLQLLTIHFPKLRILWSPSPHATAELFEELKKGREEPDAAKAAAISMDLIDDFNVDRFNPAIHDFVVKLPGVTSKNVYAILNRLDNLAELMNATQEELADILGSQQNAESLFAALHEKLEPIEAGRASGQGNWGQKRKMTGPGAKSSRFKTKKKASL
eukprot:snap_masked-scaffold1137_size60140-processed-gene-0.6 protein:Tk10571 transcript:snap_masked-scaffold1137_size60140-processed-gene-0.6-mRNA-1 annotation:"dna repair endonuclease xpf"